MSDVILDRISTVVTGTARVGERFDNFAPTRYIQITAAPVAFTIHINQANAESIDVPAGATGPIQICDPSVELITKIFLDIPAGSGEIIMLSSPNLKVDFDLGSSAGLSSRRIWTMVPSDDQGATAGIKTAVIPEYRASTTSTLLLMDSAVANGGSVGTDWFDALGFLSWTFFAPTAGSDYASAWAIAIFQAGYPIGEILSNNSDSDNVDIGGQHWVFSGSVRASFDARVTAFDSSHFWGFGSYAISASAPTGEGGFIGFMFEDHDVPQWKAIILDFNGGTEVRRLDKVLPGITGLDTTHDFKMVWGWRKGGAPFVQWIANGIVVHEQAGHSVQLQPQTGIGWRPGCGVYKKAQTDSARLYSGMRGGWTLDHYSPAVSP